MDKDGRPTNEAEWEQSLIEISHANGYRIEYEDDPECGLYNDNDTLE